MEENLTETQKTIVDFFSGLSEFLIEKNKRYGNSAFEPLGIFSKHIKKGDDALNGMLIRVDDKIKRIKNSEELRKNDCIDIIGYLTLICVEKGWTDFKDLID